MAGPHGWAGEWRSALASCMGRSSVGRFRHPQGEDGHERGGDGSEKGGAVSKVIVLDPPR